MPRKKPAYDGSQPLLNPKHEIAAIEHANGMGMEEAVIAAGVCEPMPAEPGESGGKRHSRVARQALRRIDNRISLLSAWNRFPNLEPHAWQRNARALAELRWCRAVVANGGVEPAWMNEESEE